MKKRSPKHLKDEGKAFWKKLLSEFQFEASHDYKKLELGCQCVDNITVGRKEIEEKGSFYTDRFGQPKAHPAYKLVQDNMTLLVRILRELNLDIESPVETPRPPALY